jgi:hypothetical protein
MEGEKNLPPTWDIEIFKIVTDHLKQDTREFWTRANFYLVAHAGLLSAFAVANPALTRFQMIIRIGIPFVGLFTATLWFIVLRGSIKWLQRWREQVMKLDKELDRFRCYIEVESFAEQKPLSSPSYVTQFLPLIFMAVWLAMLLSSFQ